MLEVVHAQPCSYLEGLEARLRYRLVGECTAAEYQTLLERGWRRFGCTFFRPQCLGCTACRSLRVDVARFRPSRSMRRTAAKNRDLRVVLQPASLTAAHLELYGRYHEDMAGRKGWTDRDLDAAEYFQTFVEGRHDFGHELIYLLDERPVAIALVDVLPRALSAVYCFYEPTLRARGLGIFSVLRQIELAEELGLPHLYLGYCVEGNASTRYKASFEPHEILSGRPDEDDEPHWVGPGT